MTDLSLYHDGPAREHFVLGPFYCWSGVILPGTGFIAPHAHEDDHLQFFAYHPGVVYGPYFLRDDGSEEQRQLDAHPLGLALVVPRGVRHGCRLLAGERGHYACLFSRYDERGFRPDPKRAI